MQTLSAEVLFCRLEHQEPTSREALRGLSNYTIRRESGFTIITIQIGDETIVIRVPP
ncbi:MAG TPA: hypothetical protein VK747_15305 [Blastocatellia bacterium]|nr:hypothetical protein [Blastocatellia bacterium]